MTRGINAANDTTPTEILLNCVEAFTGTGILTGTLRTAVNRT